MSTVSRITLFVETRSQNGTGFLFLEKFKPLTMRKVYITCLAILTVLTSTIAQENTTDPEFLIEKSEPEAHLRFLASDALQGRRTGEPGNDIAASYIATYLEAYGLKKAPGLDSYFQPIPFDANTPPVSAQLSMNKQNYLQGEDLLILTGNTEGLKAEAVFANFGWVDEQSDYDDYKELDVKGKIVFVLPGTPDAQDPLSVFNAMKTKRALASKKGAVALIEVYALPFPWEFFKSYFNSETLSMVEGEEAGQAERDLIYGWIKEPDGVNNVKSLKEGKAFKVSLTSQGHQHQRIYSNNVIGIIEGTDPVLKEEYIILTAHYDHVGTGKNGGAAFTPEDSIFNGARDNAMGVSALLTAAKALAKQPVKRSVIVLAVTAEEVGLLGSQYYANHPVIPLEKTVFNINTDGAGYNDVSYVSVVGYGRTGTDGLIDASANIFGLDVYPNPSPEQNLFDRSDNVSFAQKGVPAVSYGPGMTGFTEEIARYYHQAADNPDTIDFDYLHKFCQAFARAARLAGDWEERPWWAEGDKYEAAGKELYK
jgi:hypothetical protein